MDLAEAITHSVDIPAEPDEVFRRLLEIGVAAAEGLEFIVHAMPARDKFLR